MSKKIAKIQFNGGELSPWLQGRLDIAKYHRTARLCRNFIPLTEGSLKRRGGTRFVAKTPEQSALTFRIIPNPVDAVVLINNVEQNSIILAYGDTVTYEVRADGYVTATGKMRVVQNTSLTVALVSQTVRYTLTISPQPSSAIVKIAGYVRSVYNGYKNEVVPYVVYKDGYTLQSGTVLLDENKSLQITLAEETSSSVDYGAWGDPVAFIACSAYGHITIQKKCFIIRFQNGYLPILFDASKTAPDVSDIDESMFVTTQTDGYDSLAFNSSHLNQLALIRRGNQAIFYDDANGTVVAGYDYVSMSFMGWQLDENGQFATVYNSYDGSVVGGTVKVYYQGSLVWTLRGRSNG